MNKHFRTYLISLVLLITALVGFIVAGPHGPAYRVVAFAIVVISIPVVLVATWNAAPGRNARREERRAAAANSTD